VKENKLNGYYCVSLIAAMDFILKCKVTASLILLNVLVFAAVYLEAGSFGEPGWTLTLFQVGALFNPLALDREPWRFFTHLFLHGNILHLLFNMYALFSLGKVWEQYVGWKKFISVYFVCGIAAGITSVWWNLFTVGVGASGAIFGMFGYTLIENYVINRRSGQSNQGLLINFGVFLLINLLLAESFHADNSAHLGGLACGVLLGFASQVNDPRSVMPEVSILGVLVVIFFLLTRVQVQYYKIFQRVISLEGKTSTLYADNPSDSSMVTGLSDIREEWISAITSLKELKNVPPALASDQSTMLSYADIAQKEIFYQVKMLREESYIYLDSIEVNQSRGKGIPPLKHHLNFQKPPAEQKEPQAPKSSLKSVRILYDSLWVETPNRPFTYYREGQRDSLNRWQGPVRDYYFDESVQMKGGYLDDLHHGVFIYYSRHHTYEAAGRFDRDRRVGKWQQFYPNGKLEREIFYADRDYVRTIWDSTGAPMVVNGNGTYIERYADGTIKQTGSYKEGLEDGLWKGFHPNGSTYYEELFFNGRLVSGRSRNLQGRNFVYDATSRIALPEGGPKAFAEYAAGKSNEFSSTNHGEVRLYFRVTTDNRITDIIVEKSLGPREDEEAKQILLNGPRWQPARLHGQEPLDGYGFVVIVF
jgi:membrane associated rhomboid family serine protease/antitoxin component YwqK of YwqJK toxin-antitoxin module